MTAKKTTRRELHTPAASLRVRDTEGEGSVRHIEGYAILFDTPSAPFYLDEKREIREVIDPGAVTPELLASSDIKFTMFHDNHLLLARSKRGEGTLEYEIDEKGVRFSFEAPKTADGDKAVELVRSGIIDGCSFAFSTYYDDREYVGKETEEEDGKKITTYRVKKMTGIYDMTLTPDPAYPATEASVREVFGGELPHEDETPGVSAGYIAEMRSRGRWN